MLTTFPSSGLLTPLQPEVNPGGAILHTPAVSRFLAALKSKMKMSGLTLDALDGQAYNPAVLLSAPQCMSEETAIES
jgi:hypothetical protein